MMGMSSLDAELKIKGGVGSTFFSISIRSPFTGLKSRSRQIWKSLLDRARAAILSRKDASGQAETFIGRMYGASYNTFYGI